MAKSSFSQVESTNRTSKNNLFYQQPRFVSFVWLLDPTLFCSLYQFEQTKKVFWSCWQKTDKHCFVPIWFYLQGHKPFKWIYEGKCQNYQKHIAQHKKKQKSFKIKIYSVLLVIPVEIPTTTYKALTYESRKQAIKPQTPRIGLLIKRYIPQSKTTNLPNSLYVIKRQLYPIKTTCFVIVLDFLYHFWNKKCIIKPKVRVIDNSSTA